MKILIGITDIAGYHGKTAKGLRARGHEVEFVQLMDSGMGYPAGREKGLVAAVNRWSAWTFRARTRSIIHKGLWWIGMQTLRVFLTVWAICRFRNFIFVFGHSLLPGNLDLPILRLFRKRILFVFHGSDSRATWMDYGGLHDAGGGNLSVKETVRKLRRLRTKLRRIAKYANWRVDNPFSSHLQPGRLVNIFHVGTPVAGGEEGTHRNSRINVLHSPSVPLVKGTPKIVAAFEACRRTLPELTLTLITGRPNREVLEALQSCDFVADQLYADTPCAGFVLEAAALGKPAVVGGLGWSDEWLKFSGLSEYPAHVVDPDGIEEGIRRMAVDADLRENVTAAARRLARTWDVAAVAERLETILRGAAPAEWYFDPAELPVFCSGCGIPREEIADAIRSIAGVYGWSELGLDDKPRLLARAKDFAAKW